MLRSMYSGVSGLRTHQTKLDVIGNNIANVNTVAYKSSSVTFQEMLSQTIKRAQTPSFGGTGGTNPSQVGLGTSIASITTNFANGNSQSTDNPYDLAIDGNGFFMVSKGMTTFYTRAGNFRLDSQGNLVAANGEKVLGWNKSADTSIDVSNPLEAINLSNLNMAAEPTSQLVFKGNIDSESVEPIQYNMTIYDSLGEAHTIVVNFEIDPNDSNTYSYTVTSPDVNADIDGNTGEFSFNSDGKLITSPSPDTDDLTILFDNGSSEITIPAENIIFDENRLTLYSNSTTITGSQNGYESGSLLNLGIDSSGSIIGNFSNGRDEQVAIIALATFENQQGLEKVGGNLYTPSWNSGLPETGVAGEGKRGSISSNTLEMSNVDLAREFTEMIVAQRGFQANSKIITTSDEMLQELVNLKR